MIIPWDKLSSEVLRGVIEEFVLREGTDYGLAEYSLDEKVQMVLKQLHAGKAAVDFDPESESCSIVTTLRRAV